MSEDIANERSESTDRHLSLERIYRSVHLRKQNDSNQSTNSAAERSVTYMIEGQGISKVSVRHNGETREPCPCEFFKRRACQSIVPHITDRVSAAKN